MFLVHQYNERGRLGIVAQASTAAEARAICARLEDSWGNHPYGACYYSQNGAICGDRTGDSRDQAGPPHDHATATGMYDRY